jgi:diphosphomevalonate decarboxylase
LTKATASTSPNIAFIKYWGARDLDEAIPQNPSISMTLSRCRTRTTVEFRPGARDPDVVSLPVKRCEGDRSVAAERVLPLEEIALVGAPEAFSAKACRHLDRLRSWAGLRGQFLVATENNFPSDAGIASSASGFAALAVAAVRALGRSPDGPELSSLARLSGSGSAARSVYGGFVIWPANGEDARFPAVPLFPAEHWDLRDLIVIVESGPKPVSSRDGHARASTSPHFIERQCLLPKRLETVHRAIATASLDELGPVLEEEAIELHLIAMSSKPPIFYWKPATLDVLDRVRSLREVGAAVGWSTMDAGANVHVLCEAHHEATLLRELEAVPGVVRVIPDRVGEGPRLESEHLF